MRPLPGIRLAQTAYLPRVDGLAQVNRATRNTFYGLLLPQGVIPGVDGVPANNLGSVWDSGLGVLVTWQPFDFGLRAANVATPRPRREPGPGHDEPDALRSLGGHRGCLSHRGRRAANGGSRPRCR